MDGGGGAHDARHPDDEPSPSPPPLPSAYSRVVVDKSKLALLKAKGRGQPRRRPPSAAGEAAEDGEVSTPPMTPPLPPPSPPRMLRSPRPPSSPPPSSPSPIRYLTTAELLPLPDAPAQASRIHASIDLHYPDLIIQH